KEFARGMVNYSAEEIRLIAGKKSSEIEKVLGEKDYDEVIHRNNLWIDANNS
ncbi:MAG: glutamate 5-kinase, partial [Syntrophomonadaceae bacterium]|nr:glutamate 5-kinase [Syntrophomonadaceae bacterium]